MCNTILEIVQPMLLTSLDWYYHSNPRTPMNFRTIRLSTFYTNTFQSGACMCTQCRKQSGSLFVHLHTVPFSAFTWTSASSTPYPPPTGPPALQSYQATPRNHRYFCTTCGSYLAWRGEEDRDETGQLVIEICAGTIDEVFMIGHKDANGELLEGGSELGHWLVHPESKVTWAQNEIYGVTDMVGAKRGGERYKYGSKLGIRI